MGQFQFPGLAMSQPQFFGSAYQGQPLLSSSVATVLPGSLPAFPDGSTGQLLLPTSPTIDDLYTSLGQLPAMRSSISLQNLHQVTCSRI